MKISRSKSKIFYFQVTPICGYVTHISESSQHFFLIEMPYVSNVKRIEITPQIHIRKFEEQMAWEPLGLNCFINEAYETTFIKCEILYLIFYIYVFHSYQPVQLF